MARATWKVPYISNVFHSKALNKHRSITVWKRSSVISEKFLNKRFRVHNGVWLLSLNVKSSMIGHKFGEFAISKRMGRAIHLKKDKKKKKK